MKADLISGSDLIIHDGTCAVRHFLPFGIPKLRNFLIKSLTEKGIIKAKRFKNSKQKLAYLYTITPGGIRRKAILTEKFLRIKMKEYDELKIQIEKLKLEVTAGAK